MPPPSHLHAACFCMPLGFRIPRSHAAWRFRTRTHHHPPPRKPPTPRKPSILRIRISHSHSHSHAHSTIIPTLTSALTHAPITNRRCRCFCLLMQTASHHRNQQTRSSTSAQAAKSSQLNVTPPIIIIIIITHIGTATHHAPAVPLSAPMLLLATGRSHTHRAVQTPCKPPCSNRASHAPSADAPAAACSHAARHLRTATAPLLGTRNQRNIRPSCNASAVRALQVGGVLTAAAQQHGTGPLVLLLTLHGTCALQHHRCLARAISGTYGHRATQVPCAHCK
jgi:hypothetical protein